jgi:hypothetical protein
MASVLKRLAPITFLVCLACFTHAQDTKVRESIANVASLSTQQIEDELQVPLNVQSPSEPLG